MPGPARPVGTITRIAHPAPGRARNRGPDPATVAATRVGAGAPLRDCPLVTRSRCLVDSDRHTRPSRSDPVNAPDRTARSDVPSNRRTRRLGHQAVEARPPAPVAGSAARRRADRRRPRAPCRPPARAITAAGRRRAAPGWPTARPGRSAPPGPPPRAARTRRSRCGPGCRGVGLHPGPGEQQDGRPPRSPRPIMAIWSPRWKVPCRRRSRRSATSRPRRTTTTTAPHPATRATCRGRRPAPTQGSAHPAVGRPPCDRTDCHRSRRPLAPDTAAAWTSRPAISVTAPGLAGPTAQLRDAALGTAAPRPARSSTRCRWRSRVPLFGAARPRREPTRGRACRPVARGPDRAHADPRHRGRSGSAPRHDQPGRQHAQHRP